MSKFIKLTSRIINTSQISSIYLDIKKVPKKITINMIPSDLTGFILYGTGHIWTRDPSINICEEKNPQDYSIIDQWINTLDK
jgi:hypothetical protein